MADSPDEKERNDKIAAARMKQSFPGEDMTAGARLAQYNVGPKKNGDDDVEMADAEDEEADDDDEEADDDDDEEDDDAIFAGDPKLIRHYTMLGLAKKYANTKITQRVNAGRATPVFTAGNTWDRVRSAVQSVAKAEGRTVAEVQKVLDDARAANEVTVAHRPKGQK